MHLVIDASNIRSGGGVTYLVELLSAADPQAHGFNHVTVWSGTCTLDRLPDRPWLERVHHPWLDGPLPARLLWQLCKLSQQLDGCDLLFAPGGTYVGGFHPFVTMSRNLLPFDIRERARFGRSPMRLKFHLLERSQTSTFRRADGLIYLTSEAREVVEARMGPVDGTVTIIPHGVSTSFREHPRPAQSLDAYSFQDPFRWLYVSIVTVYKHQWYVCEAVASLRAQGLPIALDLVGPSTRSGLRRLQDTVARVDPAGEFIRYHGAVPYQQLATHYHQADAFVFASSCETFGQILLEAMSAGLPIACSDRSAMPEILGDAGIWFDPEQPESIARAMSTLMRSASLRARLARAAYDKSLQYSWERCANETFAFLSRVADVFHDRQGVTHVH